jgi:hypothetical protein
LSGSSEPREKRLDSPEFPCLFFTESGFNTV